MPVNACPKPMSRIKKQSHPILLVVAAAAARNMKTGTYMPLMGRGFRWFIVGKPPSEFTFASYKREWRLLVWCGFSLNPILCLEYEGWVHEENNRGFHIDRPILFPEN